MYIQYIYYTISFFGGECSLSRLNHQLLVRLDDEEHNFLESLKGFGYTKSEWVRGKIREEMKQHPENLQKEKEQHLNRIAQIDKELEKLSIKKDEHTGLLQDILTDFIEYSRVNNSESRNITWLENRYKDRIRKMAKTPQEVLEYCLGHCAVEEKEGVNE